MTDEEIRISVAEVAGWTDITCLNEQWIGHPPVDRRSYRQYLPDYPRDLNAVHEVALWLRAGGYSGEPMWYNSYLDALNEKYGDYSIDASARQRCEAILKTLGRWKDTQ